MTIVPLFSAILAILFVLLSVNVIRARRLFKIGLGTGRNKSVERAMRVHANFAEYVPLSLLLLAFLEFNKANSYLVLALCLLLTVGRLSHAFGVSQENEKFVYRVTGMMMTFSALLIAALANVVMVLF